MPIVDKLDANFIKHKLICPEDRAKIEYTDPDLPGFFVSVTRNSPNRGTYTLRFKLNSRTKYFSIGKTYEINLQDARKKALELKVDIANEIDPSQSVKDKKAVPTMDSFMETYVDFARENKKTFWKDEDLYRLRIKAVFGHRKLDDIRRQEIVSFYTDLKASGLSASSSTHYLGLVSRLFKLACEWEIISKNPAAGIKRYRLDNQVNNFMDNDQLEGLLTVLKTDYNRTVCLIALFLLSTGARLNEALKAKWEDIDVDNRVWRIPISNSKSRKQRGIPLNDSSIDVLNQLDTKDDFDYLFINRKTRQRYVAINRQWDRLRKKAGLPHLRLHDLRHQYASLLVNSGRSLYEVQQILGHSDPKVTQRYAHLSTKSLQDAANSASQKITGSMPDAT